MAFPLHPANSQMLYPGQMIQADQLGYQPRPIEKCSSTEPIVGLRVWKVVMDGGMPKLRSAYKETVWPYRKAMEKDSLHDAGIHAVKSGLRPACSVADPAGVMAGTDVVSLFSTYDADVAGEVYLWGKVDEHEQGYLAQFAYPKKLFPHADLDPVVAMHLEDEYGVPCEYRPEFTKPKKNLPASQLLGAGLSTSSITAQQSVINQHLAIQNAMIRGTGFFRGLVGGY